MSSQPMVRTTCAVSASLQPVGGWEQIRDVWCNLFDQHPDASFFISPGWVEAWLDTFASALKPEIAVFRDGDTVVGACILVWRTHWYGLVPVRRWYINTSGEEQGSPFLEFNSLLCWPGYEKAVAEALRRVLDFRPWDEVAFDGVSEGPALEAVKAAFRSFAAESRVSTNYYVDLEAIREKQQSYEAALGSKTRKHLRQNYRAYGDIVTQSASTSEEALRFLDELARLHQERWTAAGHAGAFSADAFTGFHRTLITRTFASGNMQLLRFTAAEKTIGLMYNMLCRGEVYFYQTGLSYTDDKRVSPGFVSVGKAIEHCLALSDVRNFHLMATGEHYKQRLGTHAQPIEWLLIRKKNARYHAVNGLKALKRRLLTKRPAGTATREGEEAASAEQ